MGIFYGVDNVRDEETLPQVSHIHYTHYDDYRPPITGHFRDYRLFWDFLMAMSRLLKMINGHFATFLIVKL